MAGEQVLVIEDDGSIAGFLRRGLSYEGYQVAVAEDGRKGLLAALHNPPQLVVLDLMLPNIDGLEVCRRLRAADETLPILMLTAKESIPDRVAGLKAGADDYLVKPFALEELLARMEALLRRAATNLPEILNFEDITLDVAAHEARRGNRPLGLTAKEFEVMEYFMRHPRHVLSREQLYEAIWGYDFGPESNVIEVFVRNIRTKMEAGNEPRLLHTVRGVGYVLREES